MASILPVSPEVRDYVVRSQSEPVLQDKLKSFFYLYEIAQKRLAARQGELSADECNKFVTDWRERNVSELSGAFSSNSSEIKKWFLLKTKKEDEEGKPLELLPNSMVAFLEKMPKSGLLSHQQKLDKHAAPIQAPVVLEVVPHNPVGDLLQSKAPDEKKFEVVADAFGSLWVQAKENAKGQLQAKVQIARAEEEMKGLVAKAQEQDQKGAAVEQKAQNVRKEVDQLADAVGDLEVKDAAAAPRLEKVEEAQAGQEAKAEVNKEASLKNLEEARDQIARKLGELEAERAGLWAIKNEKGAIFSRADPLLGTGLASVFVGGTGVPIGATTIGATIAASAGTAAIAGAASGGAGAVLLVGLGALLLSLWARDQKRMKAVEGEIDYIQSQIYAIDQKIANLEPKN